MHKYEFKLTPAFCLYNGAAILEQNGSYLKVLIDNDNEDIKRRLERAFFNHINYVLKRNDCPVEFGNLPKVEFVMGSRTQLRKCVSNYYEKQVDFSYKNGIVRNDIEFEQRVVGEKSNHKIIEKLNEVVHPKMNLEENAAAVLLLDRILIDAREKLATDIHIENNIVRFRMKGKLEVQMELEKERCEELVQRIKLLAEMNVLEKRRSQDGHFVYGQEKPIFLRVSTVSVVSDKYAGGEESVVLRLLDTSRVPLTLEKLGFNDNQLLILRKFCCEKNGLIIVSGATGVGKSTTTASMLMEIQRKFLGKLKIISLEDPPEYVIPNVSQVQIDEGQGRSFEQALQKVFRQDPDVLMIGEIRDVVSAKTAIRASLTGHLVFATLHASTVESAVLRLLDFGIEEKILSSVLKGVIVQDLNHFENQVNLLADVAEFNDDKNGFSHCTNYSDVVANSIREMYKFRKNKMHLSKGVVG